MSNSGKYQIYQIKTNEKIESKIFYIKHKKKIF